MKGLTSQNLRDHMTEAELIFTALADLSKRQLEGQTDKSVVCGDNYLPSRADKSAWKAPPK